MSKLDAHKNVVVLQEAFNHVPEDFRWDSKYEGAWIGKFTINDLPYTVSFIDDGGGSWAVAYSVKIVEPQNRNVNYQTIKTIPIGLQKSSALKVLGSVMHATREFVKSIKPRQFWFMGDNKNGLGPLYTSMTKKLSAEISRYGYKQTVNKMFSDTIIEFERTSQMFEELYEKVNKKTTLTKRSLTEKYTELYEANAAREFVVKNRVRDAGKKVQRFKRVSARKGWMYDSKERHADRMTAVEQRRRQLGAKISAKKRQGQKAEMNYKHKLSMHKRKALGWDKKKGK